jgi:hypothetical protein
MLVLCAKFQGSSCAKFTEPATVKHFRGADTFITTTSSKRRDQESLISAATNNRAQVNRNTARNELAGPPRKVRYSTASAVSISTDPQIRAWEHSFQPDCARTGGFSLLNIDMLSAEQG